MPKTATTNGSQPARALGDDYGLVAVWRRVPDNCLILDGRVIPLADEITTAQAARIAKRSERTVQAWCSEGHLHEGLDWRRVRGRPGNAYYLIRRSALARILRSDDCRGSSVEGRPK